MRAKPWHLAILLTGCAPAGVEVDGAIDGYFFELNTVLAWVDAKRATQDDGTLTFVNRETSTVRVRMYGADFDPTQDLRFESVEALQELSQDNARNGTVQFDLTNYERVTAGQSIEQPPAEGADDDGPRLNVGYTFGLMKLRPDDPFPGAVPPFGSEVKAKLTLEEVGTTPGDPLRGTLELSFERQMGDDASARTGALTISFDARLAHERIAECNTSPNFSACEPERPPDNG